MKNSIKIILPVVALGLFFASCEEKELPVLSTKAAPAIGIVPATIVIDKTNVNSEKFTIGFTPGSYSTPVAMASQFEIARQGTNFNPMVTLGAPIVGSVTSAEFTYKELNAALTSLGLTPGVVANIDVRVKTHATQYQQSNAGVVPVYSEAKTIAVTPFEPQVSYIYTVGAFNGWDNANGPRLSSLIDNGIYVGYLNFPEANSEFLLLPVSGSWDHKWGSDNNVNLITDGGANIKSPGAGYHKITANIPLLTIEMIPYSWGVIGDATPTGWDSDTDMTWNDQTLQWEITVELISGGFKFRLNNAWDVNLGGANGTLTAGGDNISVSAAGTYLITLNPDEQTYTITKQ
ncbi:MAG: SusF/SusE family outer membrane protein [Dysgonamonadaceae bacterium]|jgi:hypothetical protein|nr:SusF/SusE family outer membrane protein [Dysgonamonadaceae bacterium]